MSDTSPDRALHQDEDDQSRVDRVSLRSTMGIYRDQQRGDAMKIYLAAIPTGMGSGKVHGSRPGGDVLGCALAEDGTGIVTHLSSSVGYAKHDMGLTSEWKHEYYREHCPDGYELEWVDDPDTHEGWQAALVLNRAKQAAAEASESAMSADAVDPPGGGTPA